MALVRPIVYVYQEVASITVSPSSPSLNTCLVGPCYFIQDYNYTAEDDKTPNDIGNFVKSPFTTANAPCNSIGASAGKPDANTTVITVAEPPTLPAGAEVDAASVDIVFDNCYVELTKGADLRDASVPGNLLAAGSYTVTSATGAFTTNIPYTTVDGVNVPTYATRIVVTKTGGSTLLTKAIIKNIRYVNSATQLTVTSEFTTAEMAILASGDNLTFRVETVMEDVHMDPAYFTVTGNAIAVKTGALGALVTIGSLTKPVSYAEVYVGYRALRKDLTNVYTLETTDDITDRLGRVDERNPLAAAAQVAFANTSTTIQVFGVESDDLAGHTDAKDKMSTRSDVYCIVPVTDSLGASDWISVLSMWRLHCAAYADPTKSKYRIVIGSYPELPTEKSSAEPSTYGQTSASAAMTDVDVFVDPSTGTDFIGAEVAEDDILDITHTTTGALATVTTGTTIFDAYSTPGSYPLVGKGKRLYGAIGKKRIRTKTALGAAVSAEVIDYAVRAPILQVEGATPTLTLDNITWALDAGQVKLTKPAATTPFTGVSVGDVVVVKNSATHDFGYVVVAVDATAAKAYIQIDTKEVADDGNSGTLDIDVYTPLAYGLNCTVTANKTLTLLTGSFSGAKPGDIVFIFNSNEAVPITDNRGMWIVQAASANAITIFTDGAPQLTNTAGATDLYAAVVFSAKAGNGITTCTTRKRLDQLYDATASFISTINVGEHIEIPYPADTDPAHWDTTTTQWPVDTIVSNQIIIADLDTLEELAPRDFIAGFTAPNYCSYRINIDLDKTAQATELVSTIASLASNRLVMVWPNECTVANLENAKTGTASRHHGQYLACTVGGMICGLPPHQGFTFIGVAGISQIFNSNFYFSDAQIDTLSEGGWYVFLQDTETSAPYSAHEVTTDTSSYQMGELMYVKDFDYISTFYKRIMETFIGRWNINNETLGVIKASFDAGTEFLKRQVYPKIGAPIISANVSKIEQLAGETDRVEIYAAVSIPSVLNKIGLHLIA